MNFIQSAPNVLSYVVKRRTVETEPPLSKLAGNRRKVIENKVLGLDFAPGASFRASNQVLKTLLKVPFVFIHTVLHG